MQALLDHPGRATCASWITSIERAVLMAQGEQVRAGDLASASGSRDAAAAGRHEPRGSREAFLIKKALARYDGNVSHAAQGPGPEPQRALPPPAEIQPLTWPTSIRAAHPLLALAAGGREHARRLAAAVVRRLLTEGTVDADGHNRHRLAGLCVQRGTARGVSRCGRCRICSPRCARAIFPFARAARESR